MKHQISLWLAIIALLIVLTSHKTYRNRKCIIPAGMVEVKGEGNIPGFLISANPVTNLEYNIYQNWLSRVYMSYPDMYKNSLINATDSVILWNDPAVSSTLGHPAFGAYPVVGASWYQAMDYCRWKNDRINESIVLETIGLDYSNEVSKNIMDENNFNTETYLAGQYYFPKSKNKRKKKRGLNYLDENTIGKGHHKMAYKPDFLYGYRLPSEDELELAVQQMCFDDDIKHSCTGRFACLLAEQDINTKNQMHQFSSSYNTFDKGENQYKIKEWMLNIYTPEIQKFSDMTSRINSGGMEINQNKIRMYDQYGELEGKDSLGKFYFRIMDWLPGGTPLIAGNPYRSTYYFDEVPMNASATEKFQAYYKANKMDTLRSKNSQYSYYFALHFSDNSGSYRMYLYHLYSSIADDLKYIAENKLFYYTNDSIINAKNMANRRLVKGNNKRFAQNPETGSNQIGFRMVVPWKGSQGRRAYRW